MKVILEKARVWWNQNRGKLATPSRLETKEEFPPFGILPIELADDGSSIIIINGRAYDSVTDIGCGDLGDLAKITGEIVMIGPNEFTLVASRIEIGNPEDQ